MAHDEKVVIDRKVLKYVMKRAHAGKTEIVTKEAAEELGLTQEQVAQSYERLLAAGLIITGLDFCIKIIGFKVGVVRPTYNRTIDLSRIPNQCSMDEFGRVVAQAIRKSDFLSIRRLKK